jgi:hypothetical protein
MFGAVAPAADADHLVECRPSRKRIVGCVDRNQAAAVGHVLLE